MHNQENMVEQKLSIPMILLLGFAPGVVILILAFVFSSPIFGINFNIYLSLMFAIILGLIPAELGILKIIARKENKKIKEIILYNNKTPMKKLLLSIIIPFVIALSAFLIIPPNEAKLWKIFEFIPDWFRMDRVNLPEMNYLKITMILVFLLNGFLGPIVEEIYFRGYLLPRMSVFGKFAPLINSIIFSIYHFFTPYQNITRIIGVTPMIYSVWLNKDLRIGLIVHCLLNTMGNIAMLMLLF